MNVLSSELREQEAKTLYVIGNGFDRFHNMQTNYCNFRRWLVEHNYGDDFVATMEKMFPAIINEKPLLWMDFEHALGTSNPEQIHKDFFQGVDDGFCDPKIQVKVVNRIRPQLERIPDLLREWIESIPLKGVSRCLDLSPESAYLTFNYSLTLENVYYIPSNRILHIHNSVKDRSPLITGHGKGPKTADFGNDYFNVEKSLELISDEIDKLRKPVDKIISAHQKFFDSLQGISHVVVFGFSISDIDMPYFREVFYRVQDDTKWYFVVHDEKAWKKYKSIVDTFSECYNAKSASQYMNRMKPENCKYICTQDLKMKQDMFTI